MGDNGEAESDEASVHHLRHPSDDDDDERTAEEELMDLLAEEQMADRHIELGPILGPIPAIPMRTKYVRGMTMTVSITATVTYPED